MLGRGKNSFLAVADKPAGDGWKTYILGPDFTNRKHAQPFFPLQSIRANTTESYSIVPSMKQWTDKIVQKIWDEGMRNQGTFHSLPVLNGYRKDFRQLAKE